MFNQNVFPFYLLSIVRLLELHKTILKTVLDNKIFKVSNFILLTQI